jgi:hypothetical protein
MPGNGVGVGSGVEVKVGVGVNVGGKGVALDGRIAWRGDDPQMLLALQAREKLATNIINRKALRMRVTINENGRGVNDPLG